MVRVLSVIVMLVCSSAIRTLALPRGKHQSSPLGRYRTIRTGSRGSELYPFSYYGLRSAVLPLATLNETTPPLEPSVAPNNLGTDIRRGFAYVRKQPYFYVWVILTSFVACGAIACIFTILLFLFSGCFRNSKYATEPRLWERELDDIEMSMRSSMHSVGSIGSSHGGSVGSSADLAKVYIDSDEPGPDPIAPATTAAVSASSASVSQLEEARVKLSREQALTAPSISGSQLSNDSQNTVSMVNVERLGDAKANGDRDKDRDLSVHVTGKSKKGLRTLMLARRAFSATAGSRSRIAAIDAIVEELSASQVAATNEETLDLGHTNAEVKMPSGAVRNGASPPMEDNQAFIDVMKFLLKDLLSYNIDYRTRMKMPTSLPMLDACRRLLDPAAKEEGYGAVESLQLARYVQELTVENGELAERYKYYMEEQAEATIQASLNQSFLEFLELAENAPLSRTEQAPSDKTGQPIQLPIDRPMYKQEEDHRVSLSPIQRAMSGAESRCKDRPGADNEKEEEDIEVILERRIAALRAKQARRQHSQGTLRRGPSIRGSSVDPTGHTSGNSSGTETVSRGPGTRGVVRLPSLGTRAWVPAAEGSATPTTATATVAPR